VEVKRSIIVFVGRRCKEDCDYNRGSSGRDMTRGRKK